MTVAVSETSEVRSAGRTIVRNGWTPIIPPSSHLAARAWEAVHAISDAILQGNYPPMSRAAVPHRTHDDALLFGWLGRALHEGAWIERAAERLNAATDNVAGAQGYAGLFGGWCGLGWTIEHLSPLFQDSSPSGAAQPPEEDPNEEIDAALLRRLAGGDWRGQYDLIGGLAGFGVYFLERLPSAVAVRGIRLIVAELEKISERADGGIAWHTSGPLLPEWQRELCPDGYYNLGVAHGIPGIVHFLSEVCAHGIETDLARRLLEGAIAWLMAQERPPGSRSRFGSWISHGDSSDSRLAWCYGDLGIMAVLLQVARRSGREDWRRYALGLLDECLNWPEAYNGVIDAPICHGAAGIAHIFNRIYQTDGDPRCLKAALAWVERTLEMRRPGLGVGGYLSFTRPDPLAAEVWEPSPAFLDGENGIALALLAALTPVEPDWDRMLLLSGR